MMMSKSNYPVAAMGIPIIMSITIIVINIFSAAAAQQDEASLLVAFKDSSVRSDPRRVLSGWNSSASASPCSWTGVSCSSDRGHVVSLDLSASSLAGVLHLRHLAALPSLRRLSLRENSFSAADGDQDLSSSPLEELDLSANDISIAFPSVAWPSLTHLNLSRNRISAWPTLPLGLSTLDLSFNNLSSLDLPDCANLTFLALSRASTGNTGFPRGLLKCGLMRSLDLSHNGLRGGIPAELGDLPALARLSLAHNRFSGPIPPQLAVPELLELDLSNNDLSGALPSSFVACSSLASLDLSSNHLSGDFLSSVVSRMRGLTHLDLSFNNITGAVPASLRNCTALRVLDLSSNALAGNLPPGLCSGGSWSLEKFLAANNYLSGAAVLEELGTCKSLRSIDLSFNDLTGPVPDAIWRLPKLSELIMWANRISGVIPESICGAGDGNLQMLILNNNLLTGAVPESIANCTEMIWLSLSTNQLTGRIPRSLGNLHKLAIIQMGNNSLSGEIPRELGRCRSLVWLDLNSNNLTGSVPGELSHQTGLITAGIVSGKHFVFVRNEAGSGCQGAGGLIELQGMRQERLKELPIVHSCSSARIYSGFNVYTVATNGTMIYLDLSYNALSGAIPAALGAMAYLQVLNLGHNTLTGPIPPSFGDLKVMSVIDVSHNRLEGPIPGELTTLSFLSDFDVSNNNLEGVIPMGGQLTTFPAARYANNSMLCGPPLPPCHNGGKQQLHAVEWRALKQEEWQRRVGVGLIMGAALFSTCVAVMGFTLYRVRKQHKDTDETETETKTEEETTVSSSSPLLRLTLGQLVEATNGFSLESRIGAGGFGEVYKARLGDGSVVAVKKLGRMAGGQGDREFTAEMETIGRVKHRNLVALLGYCKVADERLLVYEYMPWGSLDSVLHDWKTPVPWDARQRIAEGSARALAFLHHSCVPHIIHRDMKSSNVLLDAAFEPRVSDFGMARLTATLDSHLSVTTLVGTPGYVPPEYYQSFRCTTKGDVYSFGVVLLELLSRKRPTDSAAFGDDNNLVGWARHLHRRHRAAEIFDPDLLSRNDSRTLHHLSLYLGIAFECLNDRPLRRPTMVQVLDKFKHADSCT